MFKNNFKSEMQKFIYNKWLMFVVVAVICFMPVMVLTLNDLNGEIHFDLYKSKLTQSFYLGQVWFVVLSVLYFGQEFLKSTLRTSLVSSPNRMVFLSSKLLCLFSWIFILLFISTILSFFILQVLFDLSLDVNTIVVLTGFLLPAYISIIELCFITVALVIITRSIITPMVIILSMILGLGHLLMQYSKVMSLLPVLATMNSFLLLRTDEYLSVIEGLLCQGFWSVFLMIVSIVMFKIRFVR